MAYYMQVGRLTSPLPNKLICFSVVKARCLMNKSAHIVLQEAVISKTYTQHITLDHRPAENTMRSLVTTPLVIIISLKRIAVVIDVACKITF